MEKKGNTREYAADPEKFMMDRDKDRYQRSVLQGGCRSVGGGGHQDRQKVLPLVQKVKRQTGWVGDPGHITIMW